MEVAMPQEASPPSVVTLGEAMIRYSPKSFMRIEQAQELEMRAAGAASNVAIACSRLGLRATWISKLTSNSLGRFVAHQVAVHGVDVSHVVWTEAHRVGTYYIEFGSPPRPTRILYDRAHSAFSHFTVSEVDWRIVREASLFHSTGITPALSRSCEEVATMAMQEARSGGALVSFDVNYRSKLWPSVEAAQDHLGRLLKLTDILFISLDEATSIFRLPGTDEDICRGLQADFGPRVVVLKRHDGSTVLSEGLVHTVGLYETHTVDPIGTGDAFAAGFIYGFLYGDILTALDYAAATAALKRTIPGDLAILSLAEVQELTERGGGSQIQR
jgi:2-dehydro-3-deoxygluconokinase